MLTRVSNFFASSDAAYEQKSNGFAQFVLLLSLSPTIITLALFSFGHSTPPPLYFDIDVSRFESVKPKSITSVVNCDNQPTPVSAFMDSVEQDFLSTKFGQQAAATAAQAKIQAQSQLLTQQAAASQAKVKQEQAQSLSDAEREYSALLAQESKATGWSVDQVQQFLFQNTMLLRQFVPYLGPNPTPEDLVRALAQIDFEKRIASTNVTGPGQPITPATLAPSNAPSACQVTVYPPTPKPSGTLKPTDQYGGFVNLGSTDSNPVAWLFFLSFILWLPAVWLCFRQKQFDLLFCLSAMFLMFIAMIAIGIVVGNPNTSFSNALFYIVPKIPLLWFVFRGRVLSKAFLAFIVLISAVSVLNQVPNLSAFFTEIALFAMVFAVLYFVARWIVKAPAAVGNAYFPQAIEPVRALNSKFGGNLLLALVFTFVVFEFGSAFYHGTLLNVFHKVPILSILQALLPIVVFVLTIGLLRLVILAAKENAYFLRNLGWRRCLRVAATAAIYWAPMAALAFPYLWATEYALPSYAQDALHKKHILLFPYGHDLRDNVLRSTAAQFDDKIFDFHIYMEILEDEINQETTELSSEDLVTKVMTAFDQAIPPDLTLGPVDVGEVDVTKIGPDVGPIVNQGANAALSSVADGYKSLRATIRQNIENAVAGQQTNLQSDALVAGADAKGLLESTRTSGIAALKFFNQAAQDFFSGAIAYWNAVHLASLLVFGFICVKSFLYIYARVAFNRDTGTFVTLGKAEGEVPLVEDAQITQTGGSYVIPAGTVGTFYVSRKFQARGKAPRFAIPQPLHGPIARIMHGKVTMNKIVMNPGDKGVTLTSTKGQQFIEWNVREGETVLFNFRNFVGMSEELHISTLISVRLSTLLLGEIIYSTATGPGKLLLETSGLAEITHRDQIADSLPPERLVAMPIDTRMYVESELGPVDVYLSSAYIRPEKGGQMIIDVDSQRGSGIGLARFFLHFIWPG